MDFRDYFRIIRRQWIWSLSIFLLMMSVFFSYSFLVEEQMYRATCQVGILAPQWDERVFRETSSIVPPVSYNMKTKVELLDLYNLGNEAAWRLMNDIERREKGLLEAHAEKAARKDAKKGTLAHLPFQEIVASAARANGLKPKSVGGQDLFLVAQFREIADAAARQKAIGDLHDSLRQAIPAPLSEVIERSNLVRISVVYNGELESVMLVNAIGFGAMDKDRASTLSEREQESRAIEKHIELSKEQVRQLKDRIEKFQRDHDIRELDQDIGDLRKRVREFEDGIVRKQAERLKLEHELQNPSVVFLSGELREDTPRLSELRTNLTGLEQQKTVLLIDLKEGHPDVRKLQAQIDRVKDAMQEEERREQARQQERHIGEVNKVHDSLRLLADEIGNLEQDKIEASAKLRKFSDLRFEHDDLVRSLNYASEQRDRLKQKLDAVRLVESMIRGDGEEDGKAVTGTIRMETPAQGAEKLIKQSRSATGVMVIMAVVVSVCIAYLVEYADTRIRTEEDIRKHLNLPVLAKVEKRARGEKVCLTELPPRDAFAEIFNTVTTVITSAARDLGIRVFVVSSTVAEEGKTTITVNLGVALARKGLRVILVDGDLRRPQLHDMLGVDNSTGLSTVLEGRSQAMETLSEIADEPAPQAGLEAFLKPTTVENLKILPSGPTPHDPITLLESQRMKDLVEEMRGMADFVLIDTPPIFHVGDVLTLTPLVDANLFVVGAFEVKQHEVTWAKHLLSNVGANILGAFLNKEVIESKSYYYYYRYYKGYRYRN